MTPRRPLSVLIGHILIGLGALILLGIGGLFGLALMSRRTSPGAGAAPQPLLVMGTPIASPTGEAVPTDVAPPTATALPLPTPHGFDFAPTIAPTVVVTVPTAEPWSGPNKPFNWHGSGSRLGLHVSRNSSPSFMQFVRETHPTVMKAVDDVGFLAEVKKVSPGTVTVGRFVVDQSGMGQGNPVEKADEFVQANLARYQANPGVDFWEGWNEPDPGQMDWYAQFEARRACRMYELGFRAAVGGFSTGTPEMDQFLKF
ncbi:MAG: hypothetical protein HY023_13155, partial [Chloroflexi bacterium]|nr:hypothetical protein [Chloroflexota bacterium]